MARIEPFRGILYNRKKINIAKVVAPPYDVISPSMQSRFYNTDPHNIIRLILGKSGKNDISKNNRYTRAARFLDKWLKEKCIVRDHKPSVYVYTQEYLHGGKKRTRIGFIALMKIEDPKESGILPHEYTLDKPKEDRMRLMMETRANLSPIFSLFQDSEKKVNKILRGLVKSTTPFFAVEDEGIMHKLWKTDEKRTIAGIRAHIYKKKIFIADGHHRYEVALAYRNKMRRKKTGFKRSMDYIMMYFSSLSERENLTILSTHRIVKNIHNFDKKNTLEKLKKYFYIRTIGNIEKLIKNLRFSPKTKCEHVLGMYMGKDKFYLMRLKKSCSIDKIMQSKKNKALKKLDVTVLHDIIMDKILGIKKSENSIKYARNEKDVSALVDKGDYQVAFFLRPTDIMDMKAVAENGQMMPQKSTYFYPKLLTGLVINKF